VPEQAQDYRIQYDSIVRLFVLPKSNTPHTLVVVSLDPPIRKGQTYYPHILVQFPSDEERRVELELSDEALAAKNEKVRAVLGFGVHGRVHGSAAHDAAVCPFRGKACAPMAQHQHRSGSELSVSPARGACGHRFSTRHLAWDLGRGRAGDKTTCMECSPKCNQPSTCTASSEW
jgi:hypothetical protein